MNFVCRKGNYHNNQMITVAQDNMNFCKHINLNYDTKNRAKCLDCETWLWGILLCVTLDIQEMERSG